MFQKDKEKKKKKEKSLPSHPLQSSTVKLNWPLLMPKFQCPDTAPTWNSRVHTVLDVTCLKHRQHLGSWSWSWFWVLLVLLLPGSSSEAELVLVLPQGACINQNAKCKSNLIHDSDHSQFILKALETLSLPPTFTPLPNPSSHLFFLFEYQQIEVWVSMGGMTALTIMANQTKENPVHKSNKQKDSPITTFWKMVKKKKKGLGA